MNEIILTENPDNPSWMKDYFDLGQLYGLTFNEIILTENPDNPSWMKDYFDLGQLYGLNFDEFNTLQPIIDRLRGSQVKSKENQYMEMFL